LPFLTTNSRWLDQVLTEMLWMRVGKWQKYPRTEAWEKLSYIMEKTEDHAGIDLPKFSP
jgi:hypothetical protein